MITPEPPARVLFGERLARAPRAIGKSFIARAASPAISLILVPQLLCHPVVPATIFEPSCEFLEATPNRRRFGITHTCFSTASVSRPSAGATDGSLECHEPTFRAFRKRFPGDQQVRPVQPSRGSLRLGSTCQSSGLSIGLPRVASLQRRPIFRSLRFDVQAVPIFSSILALTACRSGLPNGTSIGDLSLKDTAEFVSGAPARRDWRVDNQFRRD
jgi:hypothetical protein